MPILFLGAAAILLVLLGSSGKASASGGCPSCSTVHYPANRHGPQRDLRTISLGVIHSTEGCSHGVCPSANAVAEYFQTTTNDASTQVVIDDHACFVCLRDDTVPYGASGGDANLRGVHIEFVGTASWTRDEWLRHRRMIACGAQIMARWCRAYGFPPVWLAPADLVAERKGITSHANVTAAFHVPAGHTDPGPNFPYDVFMNDVQAAYGGSLFAA